MLKHIQSILDDLNPKMIKWDEVCKDEIASLKTLAEQSLQLENDLKDLSEFPATYSMKLTEMASIRQTILSLNHVIKVSIINATEHYEDLYYRTMIRYKESYKIPTKHEWDAAFKITLKDYFGHNSKTIKILTQTTILYDELNNAALEVINAGKKTFTAITSQNM